MARRCPIGLPVLLMLLIANPLWPGSFIAQSPEVRLASSIALAEDPPVPTPVPTPPGHGDASYLTQEQIESIQAKWNQFLAAASDEAKSKFMEKLGELARKSAGHIKLDFINPCLTMDPQSALGDPDCAEIFKILDVYQPEPG